MIYILAQGHGSRWNHETIPYKQLIPIGNTTVIERTMSMLKTNLFLPVYSRDFSLHIKNSHSYISLREPTQGILSGIVETLAVSYQYEDATFLLGDVVYSHGMMDLILKTPVGNVAMFGRMGSNFYSGKEAGEIFAIKIDKDFIPQFRRNCRQIKWTGKLWNYKAVYDTAMFSSKLNGFEDWTEDIDSQDEYELYGKKIIKLAEEEDEKHKRME